MKAQVALIASAKERTKDAMIALVLRLEDEGAIDQISGAGAGASAGSSAGGGGGAKHTSLSRPRASTGIGASVLTMPEVVVPEVPVDPNAAALFAKENGTTPSNSAGLCQ
jgi:hypothetical protein